MAKTKPQRLRELLYSSSIAIAPGCYDAIGARIIEQVGFPAAYMSGLGVAASLGYPDTGIIGAAEMTERAHVIARSIDIPLLVDADTGYGGPANIAETVRAFERAGVAGIHLEDQAMPKKCAGLPGKTLVSIAEMTARLRVALQARTNPDFVIIGRTDALPGEGLEKSIERAKAYEEAGAHATMIMLLAGQKEMAKATKALKKPTLVLMSEKLNPLVAPAQLRALGFPLILYPLSLLKRTVHAQRELASRLMEEGTTESLLDGMACLPEVNQITGLDKTAETEALFQRLAGAQAAR